MYFKFVCECCYFTFQIYKLAMYKITGYIHSFAQTSRQFFVPVFPFVMCLPRCAQAVFLSVPPLHDVIWHQPDQVNWQKNLKIFQIHYICPINESFLLGKHALLDKRLTVSQYWQIHLHIFIFIFDTFLTVRSGYFFNISIMDHLYVENI